MAIFYVHLHLATAEHVCELTFFISIAVNQRSGGKVLAMHFTGKLLTGKQLTGKIGICVLSLMIGVSGCHSPRPRAKKDGSCCSGSQMESYEGTAPPPEFQPPARGGKGQRTRGGPPSMHAAEMPEFDPQSAGSAAGSAKLEP